MTQEISVSTEKTLSGATCACCSPIQLAGGKSRREFLKTGAATMATLGLAGFVPGHALAASGNYEAMLVNCIDPRFTTLSWQYMGLLQRTAIAARPNWRLVKTKWLRAKQKPSRTPARCLSSVRRSTSVTPS